MKRVLFTAMMLISLCLSATAQKEGLYYFMDAKGEQSAGREFIDRKDLVYIFAGDSEDDCTMEMRNYKKNGNTETFDLYVKGGYEKGKKRGSGTIVTDPDLVVAKGKVDMSKQKATIKSDGSTYKYFFLTEKQYNKFKGRGGSESLNPVDKAKEKGKDLLNKGKNLFKKKKKD